MRKILIGLVLVGAASGALWYYRSGDTAAAPSGGPAASGGAPGGAAAGAGRGRGRGLMTVEMASASRAEVVDYIAVVGNLIGEATVDVVPRVAGRIDAVLVKLGDRVTKGQPVAKLEDRTIREQVNQVKANLQVNQATLVARQNDAKVAENNLERARTSFARGLLSQAALEDADSRYNSAVSQVTVAEAQLVSTQARLDELNITLTDTTVLSPVTGYVGKRNLDPGAFAGANTAILSVVDLSTVRMVANLVEKDFKRVERGAAAEVEVDAFPGEKFTGSVSRVAPVFDPATRTATMEIEVPNPGARLKPGMYARVRLVTGRNVNALTVPRAAVVDVEGKRGVYLVEQDVAKFHEVQTGLVDTQRVEILSGLEEGARVVTTGSVAIRDGERIQVAGARAGGGRDGRGGREGRSGRRGGGQGGPDAATDAPGSPQDMPVAAGQGQSRRGGQ
jgi:RND family efflux transporter MFP subunit